MDRQEVRIAFVQYHDYSSLQPDDSWSRNGLQLYYGVEQAARERGLQLAIYLHFSTDDVRRFERDVLEGSIHAIVATVYTELYVQPLLSAISKNIPVYIIGSTSPGLLASIREPSLRARAASGYTSGHAALVNLGVLADSLARQLAARLLSLGIRRVDCIHSSETNLAFLERCLTLEREFRAAGRVGATHMHTRAFVPLALALESLAADMAANTPDIPVAQTALVVMDAVMYSLVRDVKDVKRVLEGGHVAVFESFPGVLEDIMNGRPVTLADRPLYSEGYLAVALASYEIQTGLALTGDLPSAARVISAGEVTETDVIRELCRGNGYPVCGDPGVPDISPSGCRCFNRSDVVLRVLATIPARAQAYANLYAGLLDGQRDFPGSTFEWDAGTGDNYRSILATASVNASIAANNWTSLFSLDQWISPVDPALESAMRRIGTIKGNRSYFLGLARGSEGDYDTGPFLARYASDGYLGPSGAAWRSAGAFARSLVVPPALSVASQEQSALMYMPLLYMPGWVEMGHQVVEGFFNRTLSFPPGFWGFPIKDAPENRTGVWSTFYDGWTAAAETTAGASSSRRNASGEESTTRSSDLEASVPPDGLDSFIVSGEEASIRPPTLVSRPSPPAFSSRGPFVEGLQTLLQDARLAGASYGAVVISPVISDDVPLALQVIEEAGIAGYLNATKLISIECFAPDYQAFAYPESMVGGARHSACVDWQAQLITYTAYMLSVLLQHTHGERVLVGELPTERLATRDQPIARKRRMADCLLYRAAVDAHQIANVSFPVCNHAAGCGPNASNPCSGNGVCSFPSAKDNAKSKLGELTPSVGWCECKFGHEGVFCERQRLIHRSQRLMIGLMAMGGVLGLAVAVLLLIALYRGGKNLSDVQKRRRQLEARKKKPPAKGQPVAVVHAEIEGSTALWEWDPSTWGHSMHIYQRVLRALLPNHHGYESLVDSDAFQAVFHDASDALHWAIAAQVALMHPEGFPGKTTKGGSLPPFPLSWPDKLLSHPLGEEVHHGDGTILYRGPRVRVGIHVGVPSGTTPLPNGRHKYVGSVVELAKAVCATSDQGGPVLMSMDAWAALDSTAGLSADDLHITVFNMGEHLVSKDAPPTQIMQVLPQSLLHRAPFRPLRSYQQLSPSFFDAPGAYSYAAESAPVDPVAILFTFIGAGPRLKAHPEYTASVNLLSDFTRRILVKHRGYECEEKNGNFLLAFKDAMDAALFTQELQAGAIYLPWPEMILDHPAAAEVLLPASVPVGLMMHDAVPGEAHVLEKRDKFIFRGLRIKCGFYWGVPTRCMPHASTGRAAYFGPLMNRAARIASIAASGQTLCNSEAVEALRGTLEAKAPDVLFSSLGQTSLKGVAAPVEIFQVSSSAISARAFPRLTRVSRALRLMPESFIPGQGPTSVNESGAWGAAEASRFFHWQDSNGNSSSNGRSSGGSGTTDLERSHRGSGHKRRDKVAQALSDADVRVERRSSVTNSLSSYTDSSRVSYTEHLSRWEVEIAAPVKAAPRISLGEGTKGGNGGMMRRPSKGRLSLDSLVHALDHKLHALSNIAEKVLPIYSVAAAQAARKVEGEGEAEEGSIVGDVEPDPNHHFLCAISFPDADAGTEDFGRAAMRVVGGEKGLGSGRLGSKGDEEA